MKQNRVRWLPKDLIGFSLTSLFNDFSHELTTSLLPAFVHQIAGPLYGPVSLGIITGCADAASTFMKLISGLLTDRIRFFKPILILGYAITPLFVSIIGTAQHVWQILVYQTMAWLGKGLREPMRDTWLANKSDFRYYGRIFGIERFFDTVGAIAGPVAAFYLLKTVSLRSSFFAALLPGAVSVLCLIFLTTNYHHTKSRSGYSWKEHIKSFSAPFKHFILVMLIFGIANFNKTFFIYRAQEMLLGQAPSLTLAIRWSILLYILLNCIRALAELSMGYLSDYIDRKTLLAVFGFGLFSLVNVLLLFATTQIYLWALIFIGAGWSLGTVSSLEKSYAAQLLPEDVRGTGFGILQSIDGVGDLVSSMIVGLLWNFISPTGAFIYAGVLSCAAFVLFLLLNNYRVYTYKSA